MAFDGPGPFDGDPAWDLWNLEFKEAPDDAEAIIEDALATAVEQPYIDVDMGVWAWVSAELVAHFSGEAGEPLPVEFARLAVKDVSDLAGLALGALDAIAASSQRSELAGLWSERGEGELELRLTDLRRRLEKVRSERA